MVVVFLCVVGGRGRGKFLVSVGQCVHACRQVAVAGEPGHPVPRDGGGKPTYPGPVPAGV